MNEKKISRIRKHDDREDLAGEHIFSDLGQLILLVIFLISWIADSFFFKYSIFLNSYFPLYLKLPLAAIILFISGYLARAGLKIVFGQVREQPAVIQEGVFQIIRHPIYLAAVLLYLGLLILSFSIISFGIWFIIILFYIYISKHEEKLLIEKFGRDYQEYMNEVPMFLPCIMKKSLKK